MGQARDAVALSGFGGCCNQWGCRCSDTQIDHPQGSGKGPDDHPQAVSFGSQSLQKNRCHHQGKHQANHRDRGTERRIPCQ